METLKEWVLDLVIAAVLLFVVTAQGVISNKGLSCGGTDRKAEVAGPARP